MRKRFIPRHSTTVAVLALCLAVAGSATAASLITGKQIKDGSVTGADIKRGSIAASDLSRAAKRKLRGQRGPAGPPGVAGPPGLSRLLTVTERNVPVSRDDGVAPVIELALPPGSFTVDASLLVTSQGTGDTCELRSSRGLLEGVGFTINKQDGRQVHLQGEFQNDSTQGGRVRVSCVADDQLLAKTARIRAIEVGRVP